ncbi:MAG TPA: hypothetical protein VMG41_13030 [Gemmatimonadales bacterium]|nr:hypothetical protein [Gemmatimonadales bacterium]
MKHVLTISRVTVTPEHEAEYVRTVHQLSQTAATRAQHLWLFRSTVQPHSYIEFSESRSELAHRARASRTDVEERLERRLREIATYAPDAWDLWEEVPGLHDVPGA